MNDQDPRPLMGRALDQTAELVESVSVGELSRPTPCTDYDVRTLLGHLITVVRRIDLALHGGNPLEIPVVTTGTPDSDWPAAWTAVRRALDETLGGQAVLNRICTLPWGTLPGSAAIAAYATELTTHGWDLAMAIDRTGRLDPDLAETSLALVRRFVPAEPRGGPIPFGAVIAVADGAPPYDRLAGWTGRDPAWTALST